MTRETLRLLVLLAAGAAVALIIGILQEGWK